MQKPRKTQNPEEEKWWSGGKSTPLTLYILNNSHIFICHIPIM